MSNGGQLSPFDQGAQLTVRDILQLPHFQQTDVLGGAGGLDRIVASVNVMENPDIVPWVKAHELLITVGYSLRGENTDIERLLRQLADRNLAAFGLKLGRYITELAPSVLELADELDFPVLALPASVSFDDIISDVYSARNSRLVGEDHSPTDLQRRLIEVALAGGSASDVAERFSATVQCEIAVIGTVGDVLLHSSGREGIDPPPRDLGVSSQFHDAISAPVVAGSTYVGQLHVFPADGVRRPQFTRLVSTCAQFMALAASREVAVAAVDRQFHSELMTNVLHSRLDPTEVERRCHGIGWALRFPSVVITVSPVMGAGADAGVDVERVQSLFAQWLRRRRLHPPTAIVDGAVVAIVEHDSPDVEVLTAGLTTEVLASRLAGYWSGGVSALAAGMEGLKRAWGQAEMAARVGAIVYGVGHAMAFADLGAYRLLSEIDDEVLTSFAHDALGALLSPEANRTELKETLAVLLDTNLNVAETARQLHYHYNTVRYRIVQLEKLLGPFQTDSSRCLELRLALLICEMPTTDVLR